MALINTDWTKELEQVEHKLAKFLDEKLEPMADRILDRGIAESSVILAKASFEIQEAIKQATQEIESQRKSAIKEIKHLIYFAGFSVFIVMALTSIFISGVMNYFKFFQ
jgi:F0F1-type ATP synthase membrane subunit b/b'